MHALACLRTRTLPMPTNQKLSILNLGSGFHEFDVRSVSESSKVFKAESEVPVRSALVEKDNCI